MNSQLQNILKAFKLDILSEKNKVFQLHIDNSYSGSGEDIPSEFRNMKIIFARDVTMGFILGKTYYVRPDFFIGGKHHNIFIEQETNMIKNMHQLEKVVAIEGEATQKLIELEGLKNLALKEVDLMRLEDIKNAAELLAKDLENEFALKYFNEINKRYLAVYEANKPSDSELITDLLLVVEAIKSAETEEEIQSLLKSGQDLLTKLPEGENEVRSAAIFIKDLVQKSLKGPIIKGMDPNDFEEDLEDLEKNKLADLLKKAEQAYDKKDMTKAKNLYTQVLEINPKNGVAKEKLELIKINSKQK